mmetsp:Transcript_35250/g.63459  ORF Transcript_35250/g.63459 Transcript_35250/m.63459 type:complete len:213 (-) Transcript_35250:68-706(-)
MTLVNSIRRIILIIVLVVRLHVRLAPPHLALAVVMPPATRLFRRKVFCRKFGIERIVELLIVHERIVVRTHGGGGSAQIVHVAGGVLLVVVVFVILVRLDIAFLPAADSPGSTARLPHVLVVAFHIDIAHALRDAGEIDALIIVIIIIVVMDLVLGLGLDPRGGAAVVMAVVAIFSLFAHVHFGHAFANLVVLVVAGALLLGLAAFSSSHVG